MIALSMTGYSRVRKTTDDYDVTVSVKSVNHRGLDIHFRMPPELDAFEPALRNAIRKRVARGHLQVQVRYATCRKTANVIVNQPLLEAYLQAFHRMSAIHGLRMEADLNSAFRIPGMFESAEDEPDPETESALVAVLDEALNGLDMFRGREGAAIAADMRMRNSLVLKCARQMDEIRVKAVGEFQARLSEKLAELLKGAIDQQRLAQEVAYLVDRSDISEELTRLKVHAVQLHDLLEAGGEIGKKVDFLLQEMHRETNTILSKSAGAGDAGLEISDLALTVKAEIEKIREQGLNLE